MKHEMFAIFDSKAHAYLPPFIIHQKEMAVRIFADCVNDNSHQFGKNPADYTLFHIGEFDDNSAKIKSILNTALANGLELIDTPFAPDQADLPLGDETEKHLENKPLDIPKKHIEVN